MPLNWATTQRSLGVALQTLGYTRFYEGDFAAAALDLQEVVDGTNPYPILGLYLARARTGRQDAKRDLEQSAAGLKLVEWPSPVIKLFLEQGTPEAIVAAADKPEERCEAQYYLGEWHILRNARERDRSAAQRGQKLPKKLYRICGCLVGAETARTIGHAKADTGAVAIDGNVSSSTKPR